MDLVYKKAGNIKLVRRSDSAAFLQSGIVQSIKDSITIKTASLPDGNSDYDNEFTTGKDAQIVVNMSSFQPHLYAALIGATYTKAGSYKLPIIQDDSIPATTPFTIDVTAIGTPETTPVPVVHDAADSPYVMVSATPATGQFSVSGAVFTFSSADAGEAVKLNFDVTKTADKMELPSESRLPVFEMTITGEAVLYDDEGTAKRDAIVFDTVKLSGDVSRPERGGDPKGWTATFKLGKPRSGNNAVDYIVEN